MIQHTALNKLDFASAIKETKTFGSFPKFKKGIVVTNKNIERLYDYYLQACRYKIGYLKQNPNIFSNDVLMIEEVIAK
jgi:transposase-like protein